MNIQPQMIQQIPSGPSNHPFQNPQEKLDNISKVKTLLAPLRESLSNSLKSAAHTLHQNTYIDAGPLKGVDESIPRFDRNLEEFYSLCDQMELNLKTSIECMNQYKASQTYMAMLVNPNRFDPIPNQEGNHLTYPNYLGLVRSQVHFVRELHHLLLSASINYPPTE